jgi:DNA transposition AAA+ family ATPase
MSETKAWIEESHPEHAADTGEALRERLRVLSDAESGSLSIGQIARRTGWSTSVISQYIAGKYTGDNTRVERSMRDFLGAMERERMIGVSVVKSEATEEMAEALELLRASNDAGVIFGDAGIGKTTGIVLYIKDHPTTLLITLSRWSRDQASVERKCLDLLGRRAKEHSESRGEYIVRCLRGSGRLVIVDNAHKATRPALEWLIDFHDATGCPLALVGNEEVTAKIDDNAQRHSRMLYRREITVEKTRPMIRHLAREIVPDWDAAEVERGVDAAADVDGRFRNVTKLLKLAREFERKLGAGLGAGKYLELAARRQVCRVS